MRAGYALYRSGLCSLSHHVSARDLARIAGGTPALSLVLGDLDAFAKGQPAYVPSNPGRWPVSPQFCTGHSATRSVGRPCFATPPTQRTRPGRQPARRCRPESAHGYDIKDAPCGVVADG